MSYYNSNKYAVKEKYPRKEDYIIFYVYSKGTTIFTGTFVNLKKFFLLDPEMGVMSFKNHITNAGNLVEEHFNESEFNRDRKAYADKENALLAEYKKELYENESLFSDKINDIIYGRAERVKHSEGMESVEDEFTDLLDFVGDILKVYKKEKV